MERALRDRELLELIGNLAAQGASGRLQIITGMTKGAVFFDKGQIVDASLGKLSGFQAINAISSIPEADFQFDASIAPPVESSITANERMLLNDFFGIGEVHEPHYFDGVDDPPEHEPEQVVPLSEVEDVATPSILDTQPVTETAPYYTNADSNIDHVVRADVDQATRPEPGPVIGYRPVSQRSFRPALFISILAILVAAAAAVVFLYRWRSQSSPAPATVQTPADLPQATSSQEVTSSVTPDLNGNWKVINTIEQTSYQRYKNLEIGFELAINQTGNEFTGKGQKVSENGRSLSGSSRTPIVVQGSIAGDKVEATFSESGALRKTSGRFVWTIDKASGVLTGTFATNAARSSGRSSARKDF